MSELHMRAYYDHSTHSAVRLAEQTRTLTDIRFARSLLKIKTGTKDLDRVVNTPDDTLSERHLWLKQLTKRVINLEPKIQSADKEFKDKVRARCLTSVRFLSIALPIDDVVDLVRQSFRQRRQ